MTQKVQEQDCGEVVRRLRLARGFTQQWLAARAELSLRALRNIELGSSIPRQRTVVQLATALGVEPDMLRAPSLDWRLQEMTERQADIVERVLALPPSELRLIVGALRKVSARQRGRRK